MLKNGLNFKFSNYRIQGQGNQKDFSSQKAYPSFAKMLFLIKIKRKKKKKIKRQLFG
jgi:hypothetical protein